MFCNHEYVPRSGMDSGSICIKCYKIINREVTVAGVYKPLKVK